MLLAGWKGGGLRYYIYIDEPELLESEALGTDCAFGALLPPSQGAASAGIHLAHLCALAQVDPLPAPAAALLQKLRSEAAVRARQGQRQHFWLSQAQLGAPVRADALRVLEGEQRDDEKFIPRGLQARTAAVRSQRATYACHANPTAETAAFQRTGQSRLRLHSGPQGQLHSLPPQRGAAVAERASAFLQETDEYAVAAEGGGEGMGPSVCEGPEGAEGRRFVEFLVGAEFGQGEVRSGVSGEVDVRRLR